MLLFRSLVASLSHDFLVNQLFKLLFAECIFVLIKIEELFRDWRSGRLVFGIVVRLQVRVLQRVLNGDSLNRVERKKFLQQVDGPL